MPLSEILYYDNLNELQASKIISSLDAAVQLIWFWTCMLRLYCTITITVRYINKLSSCELWSTKLCKSCLIVIAYSFGKSSGENLDVRPNSPRMPCRDDRLQLNDTKPGWCFLLYS